MTARTAFAFSFLVTAAAHAQTHVPLVTQVRWQRMPSSEALPVELSGRKQVTVPELPSAPKLDGHLDDAAWRRAATTDRWMINTGEGPAPVQTKVWFGTFKRRLYVGARAEEPKVAGIVARVKEDGGPAWNDDCIEMFVDGNLDFVTARQLVVNSIGTVTGLRPKGKWKPKAARAARVGESAWIVELALPMGHLGITGTDFGLNFCRERRAAGGNQLSCWCPTGGGFNQPSKFALASLPGGYLQAFSVGDGQVGRSELAVVIKNPNARDRRLSARLVWQQGDKPPSELKLGPYTLKPNERRDIVLRYDIALAGLPAQLQLSVIGEEGEVLAEREVSQHVADVLGLAVSRCVFAGDDREMTVRGLLHLSDGLLRNSRVTVAVLDSGKAVEASQYLTPPGKGALRARLSLPELVPGDYALALLLDDLRGEKPRRIAEEKAMLHVLPDVASQH